MNIKAIIPTGQTEITVNGLHQWDYGRKLEIHASDLPALIEVHFACPGMREAVARACHTTDGAASVAIPDQCLEQSAPVTAWIYEIGETSGTTIKTITLPIIARAKPQTVSLPQNVSDKYTEAVGAFNEIVEKYESGDIVAAEAVHASEAEIGKNAVGHEERLSALEAQAQNHSQSLQTHTQNLQGHSQSITKLTNFFNDLNTRFARLTARVAALEEITELKLTVSYSNGNAVLNWNTISAAAQYKVVIGGVESGQVYYTTGQTYTVTPDMVPYYSSKQCYVTAINSSGAEITISNDIYLNDANMAVCATVKVYNESRYSDIIVTYIDEEGNQDQAYVDKANSEISHNATIKAWKGAPFYIGDSYGGHETIAVYSSSYAYSTDSDGRYAFDIDGDGSIEIDVGAG